MLFFRRHHIIYFQGLRSGTLGITEHVQLGHVQSGNKPISLLKKLRSLATSTHNHIHANESIRHNLFDFLHLRCKKSRIITTTHQFQNFITPRLQRNMEMWHKTTGMGYKLNNFIRKQIRFNGRYTITLDSFYLIQRLHQIKESLSRRLTKITDIHPSQDYLFTTFRCSLPSLFDHRSNSSVTTPPPCKRNGTI